MLLLGCGQSQDATDGGTDAATPDASTTDGGSDADGSTLTDGSVDSGPQYPPALWSLAVDHVSYADGVWAGDTIGVAFEGATGMTLKKTTLIQPSAVTAVFDDGDAGVSVTSPYQFDKNVIEVGPVQDGHGWQQATLTKQGTQNPMQIVDPTTSGFYPIFTDTVNPIPRVHQDPVSQVMAFDGLPSGTYSGLQPNGLLINKRGFGNRVFPGGSSNTIAIDAVRGDASSRYCLGGRLGGSFDLGSDAGAVTGNGFFVADFVPALTAIQWINVFGGTPLYAVGTAAPEGTGIRLGYSVQDGSILFTFPFTGTVDFGSGKTFTAPTGGQASALGMINASGTVTFATAFNKGSGSSGKPTRPSAYVLRDNLDNPSGYRFFDTVWDTIDLAGTTVSAGAGADVVIADFDLSGKLTAYRVYGGPGDDEAYRISTNAPMTNDYVILGHSTQSIDFGNGALTTSSAEGEVWLARVSP